MENSLRGSVLREASPANLRDTTHLRFVQEAKLPATTGAVTVTQSVDVFATDDPHFHSLGTDVPGPDTAPGTALVYEIKKDGNFVSLFSSFGNNWRRRLLTQGQVVAFCREHRDCLRQDGFGTLFACQVEGAELPVVFVVRTSAGRLKVLVDPWNHGLIWHDDRRHRVIVVQ